MRIAALALAGLLAACSSTVAPPSASPRAVRAANAPDIPVMRIGVFRLSPALPPAMDRAVGLRAATLKPPNGKSFSAYLGETLGEQLRLAGKLDAASPLTVSAEVTESSANPKIGQARGALAATFRLDRDGRKLFEKNLRVDAVWNSSFIGAVAIPVAEQEYVALYTRLVETLLEDPEFRTALRAARAG